MEQKRMKRAPRRRTIQYKLGALVIGSILAVAVGLMLISYYFFCQRADDRYNRQLRNAVVAASFNVEPGVLDHFWKEISTEEFRELRARAEAADDEEMIADWLMSRPCYMGIPEEEEAAEEATAEETAEEGEASDLYVTLMDDYTYILTALRAIKDYFEVDSVYYQYCEGDTTYNIADVDENLLYIGSIEAPIQEFAAYSGNVTIPPTAYRSSYGWLYTTVEPIMDFDTGETVGVAGVDLNMTEVVNERYWFLSQCLIFVAILLLVSILSAFFLLQRTAVRPLRQLSDAATRFAKESRAFTKDDVIQLDIRSNDEIGDLYQEIRSMENRIVDYTEHLTQVTAEKERVGTELRTAAHIQESMLPRVFPAFPERKEFSLYAGMIPAKEVGGDFYDFFLIDDRHLAVLIADVSDKGVPAALFMMSAKILLNYRAQLGGSPSEILGAVNAQLCKNNDSKMFVTVWMGLLDLETGLLTCANAGHEYPVIRGQDGVFRVFKDRHGLVIGALLRSQYRDYEIQMAPGDAIFVYTDGVPEANNAAGEFYGMERMEKALNRLADRDPQQLLQGIKEDVDAFTGDAKQFDDLTMLCLEYRGRQAESGEKEREA